MADDDDNANNSTGTSRSCLIPAGVISVVSVFVTVLLVAILGRPFVDKAPPPQGPDIRLVSLYVFNFSASDSQLRGTYHVGFKMGNPNEKMDMSLDEFRVSILHRGAELARTRVQELKPIPLERMTEKDVKVSMRIKSSKLTKKIFAELEEGWSRRVVNFHVGMQVTVEFGAADLPLKLFDINCGQLHVFFHGIRKDAGRLVGIDGGKCDCLVEITE